MIVFSALMIWKGLMFLTLSESPVVVVLRSTLPSLSFCPAPLSSASPSLPPSPGSGSMMPAFQRGDILFLTNYNDPIRVGEIVVFKIKDRDIPIVHRVLKVHEKEDGEVEVLTKGDANRVDDIGLYAPGQRWLKRSDILGETPSLLQPVCPPSPRPPPPSCPGRATGVLRYLGMVTIILNDYPALKFVLIGQPPLLSGSSRSHTHSLTPSFLFPSGRSHGSLCSHRQRAIAPAERERER
jgi:signal peptidase I